MNTNFGYLQARLQARYATLPDENQWLHLAGLKEFASFLEELRNSPMSGWITGLSGSSSPEDIEKHLRSYLLDTMHEIAGWFNSPWSFTFNSLETLLELPTIDYLVRYGSAAAESIDDPEILELLHTGKQSDDLLNAWIVSWMSQWPQMSDRHYQAIESLIELLKQHRVQFTERSVKSAWEYRQELENKLRFFFRRNGLQPVAAFAYLVLVVLVLERLRAELLQRALFSEAVAVPNGDV